MLGPSFGSEQEPEQDQEDHYQEKLGDMANAGGGAAGEGEWLKVAQLRALVQEDHRAKVSPGPTRFSFPFASPHLLVRAVPCVRPPLRSLPFAHTSAS